MYKKRYLFVQKESSYLKYTYLSLNSKEKDVGPMLFDKCSKCLISFELGCSLITPDSEP